MDQVKFYKLDVDNNPNLTAKFNVASLPTMIFFKNGKEVERRTGAIPKTQIEETIQSHF